MYITGNLENVLYVTYVWQGGGKGAFKQKLEVGKGEVGGNRKRKGGKRFEMT